MPVGKDLVSIVIPTINQLELVENCLNSFVNSLGNPTYEYELIIVDDGSPPELQNLLNQKLSAYQARLIPLKRNLGFARAVNTGASISKGNYICLVNNDITFNQTNWLDLMLKEARKPGVGVVGPRLIYNDGRIQHAGMYYIPETRSFDCEHRFQPGNFGSAARTGKALSVTGAIFLVKKQVWQQLNGMGKHYFAIYEDVDFSLRTWEQGYQVIYAGDAVATHYECYTRGVDNPKWQTKNEYGTRWFYHQWSQKLSLLTIDHSMPSYSESQAFQWEQIIR